MKTKNVLIIVTLSLLALFTACHDEVIPSENPELKSVSLQGTSNPVTVASVTLFAGQTTNVGSLVLTETDTNADGINDAVSATYSLTGGWQLNEVHFWIGTSLSAMPQTKTGNPQVGQFPYSPADVSGKTSYTIVIPFSSINYTSCQASYIVAAHASVHLGTRTETAWAAGSQMNVKGSWATYFSFSLIDNNPPVVAGVLADITVEGCSAEDVPAAAQNVSALEELGLAIADTRTADANLIVSSSDVSEGSCPIEVTRTYHITDACGNTATINQKIYVEDITAPVLSGQGAAITITAPALPVFTSPSVSDNCDENPSVIFSDVTVSNPSSSTITRTWTATDACGNVSLPVSQSITINAVVVVPPEENECTSWRTETGFGGNASGNGNAWWYYYNGNGTQTIWAGQNQNAGNVNLVNGYLIITLTDGWELQNVSESVKIQEYSSLPGSRPVAGQFTTYKGTSLTVSVGSFPYYVVHLDVQKCTSYN